MIDAGEVVFGAIVVGVIGLIAFGVQQLYKHLGARDALVIKSATYRDGSADTTVIVVVKNRSDTSATLTGSIHLEAPAGSGQTSESDYLLVGPGAGEIRDDGIKLDPLDERTLTFTVQREGAGGTFDLHGLEVVVHAGSRSTRKQLRKQ